jgi:hypothetical protein
MANFPFTGFLYPTTIQPGVQVQHLPLPSFGASPQEKFDYLRLQVFPANEISRFNIGHLFAYYCANMVQFIKKFEDRATFLDHYALLVRNQLDTRYFDTPTPPQNNTVIFNAVNQINIVVVKDLLRTTKTDISDLEVEGFCKWLIGNGNENNYRDYVAVLRSLEDYHRKRAIAADDLFMAIANDLPDEEIVEVARRLKILGGDFTEAIDAAIGEERKLEPDEKFLLTCLVSEGIVSRKSLVVPLLRAISAGQSFRFGRILTQGVDVSDVPVAAFQKALEACPRDRAGFATMLLMVGAGAKLNEPNPDTGDRLIQLAAQWGDLDLVELLIAWGADPNGRNNRGQVVLDFLSPEQRERLDRKNSH